ncbi:MAG TPA: YfbR-like 5'-deoxynucleotidase [Stellaceae bacterium]|nr:YfbR-like 5'-deoxynucleotidase [Stellaceae bacterium]
MNTGGDGAPRVPTHLDRPRTLQRMLSGRLLHLLDPSPLDIEIGDLLTGISRVNRWCGQTRGECGYNVAQHSVVVEAILLGMVAAKASRALRQWALVHDLAEGVFGDIVTPVKAVIGEHGYRELEQRLERAIRLRIGLPATLPPDWHAAVKRADRIAAVTEAVRLAGWSEADARRDVGLGYRGALWAGDLEPWDERTARTRWMERFTEAGGR